VPVRTSARQSDATVTGVHYTLSFWAAAAFSSNNSIAVSWNGQTVLARSNVPALPGHNPTGPGDYTEYTVDVVGRAGTSDRTSKLTRRELEIVHHVAMGQRAHEIADELFIAPTTVQTHIRNAMAKVGARSQAQLVAFVFCHGLLDAELLGQLT